MDETPEFGLFGLALRQPHDVDALRRAIAAAPDWSTVIEGARRHRVAPNLLAGLAASGSTLVPDGVMAELRRRAVGAAERSLRQVAGIARVTSAFAQADVRVLAIKGVALSAQLFGDTVSRTARDIDLLIDAKDFARAERVLAEEGYRRAGDAPTARQGAAWMRRIKDVEYVHPTSRVRLELHHRLTDNRFLLDWDFASLWSERAEVRLGDAVVATLSRPRLALYLCAHGASHAWERLHWLVDLATVLRRPADVDAAIVAAGAVGLGPAMLHATMLAHDWLGLEIADHHLASARTSAAVRRLHRILTRLYAGEAWHRMPRRGSLAGFARYSLWQRLYRLALKSDWRYRASQARREWFTPADFTTVRLPDALFFLYPLVRPLGWLVRRWQR